MPEETPQLLLELLALGELPDAESESLRDALAQDGDARLDEIATSNAAILERYPPAMIGARLRQRLVPPQVASTPWRMWAFGAVAAAAAAVTIWWIQAPSSDPETQDDAQRIALAQPAVPANAHGPRGGVHDGVRIKGSARLILHWKTAQGSVALVPGDEVAGGEFVQLSYEPGSARYGVIVSVDGAGGVSLHWPAKPDSDTALERSRTRLKYSFQLDEAPAFERFVFVTADQPLDPARVLNAADTLGEGSRRRDAPLALPDTWDQVSFTLAKPG
ncbi:MAG: hypothetical protein JKY37_33215 [Nannocystaceae bacterium]|nr:hypothetical protein [Nannocystaceae bacterium]